MDIVKQVSSANAMKGMRVWHARKVFFFSLLARLSHSIIISFNQLLRKKIYQKIHLQPFVKDVSMVIVTCQECARKSSVFKNHNQSCFISWVQPKNLLYSYSHTLRCHPGWTGPNCTECVKRSSCEYGRCVNRPFECQCYSGYKGITCEIPVCKVGCNETGVSWLTIFVNVLMR